MIPATKVSIEHFPFVEDDIFTKLFVLIHASDSRQSKNAKRCYLFWLRPKIKLLILSHRQLDFLHQNLKPIDGFLRRVFIWYIVVFLYCISFLIVRKFQEKTFYFEFFSKLKLMIHQNYRFYLFDRVGIENIFIVEKFSMGEMLICVPCISVLTVQIFQKRVPFSFRTIWNLYFWNTTCSKFSIMNSVLKKLL